MLAVLAAASAFQVPASTRSRPAGTREQLMAGGNSRRAVLLAAPLTAAICGDTAAHAFSPLDIIFGWIPEVGCTSGDKSCGAAAATAGTKPPELSNAEKIRRRRLELEQEEQAKLMAEYQKNQSNRAASRATDASGAR